MSRVDDLVALEHKARIGWAKRLGYPVAEVSLNPDGTRPVIKPEAKIVTKPETKPEIKQPVTQPVTKPVEAPKA